MRPILRPAYTGPAITDYKSYLSSLLTAYGNYCSYCERMDKVDVEHVVPKSHARHLEVDWHNLLLGCPRCNRDFKKNRNTSRVGYVWPDEDNTYTLLKYHADGRVEPAAGLPRPLQKRVLATLNLVCLDDSTKVQKPLCLGRRTAFQIAEMVKQNYLAGNQTLEEIKDFVRAGHWSVWYTVFRDIPEVMRALAELHPNTDIHRV
ncbi:HNH endonuclease [Martelella alba]|uniref:HNH nuclease domain-containing protein n=1 Tax=Martelella alba TaxID=2590451 RepID=A0ABY2SJY9_9HYPH|nr:HNH endonuclease [Martelella alba]TKI05690.1 hypothetical protein FCN80_13575 [Martelella alba]